MSGQNIKFVSLLCYVFFITASVDVHDHGNESLARSKLIDEIAEHLGAATKSQNNHTIFTYKDLEKLFGDLNFRNCSEEENSTKCNLCLNPKDFVGWYNYSSNKTYNEEEFREILNGVLYFLIPPSLSLRAVCKTFKTQITSNKTSSLFNVYLNKYANDNKLLNEGSVEKILEDVNKTLGDKLTGKECFSVHDVIKGANVSETGFGKHDFEYVSAFIIVKLLDKKCIKHEEHKTAVIPGMFVESILSEFGNKTHMTHENFEALVKKLKIGNANVVAAPTDAEHNHRRKRSVVSEILSRVRRATSSELSKCYSAEQLLTIFSVPEGSTLNKAKFQEVCPALVQQIENGACNSTTAATTAAPTKSSSTWESWIGMFISISIISFGSLIGLFVAPYSKKSWFPYVIMYLIAVAVATLLGDALLHLIPHSLNLHKHDEANHDDSGGNEFLKSDSFLWKMVLVLVGFYVFYMFEILMHAFGGNHSHSHNVDHKEEHLEETHKHIYPNNGNISVKGTLQMTEDNIIMNKKHMHGSDMINTPAGLHECEGGVVYIKDTDEVKEKIDLKYLENGTKPKQNTDTLKSFRTIVWTVLIGDAIHNFMDGLAIGVAFSEEFPSGLHGGISTSIAILCHELPHELGDFAILIASGLTIKQALVMNFISSLTAFGGAALGVGLGSQWNATPWIFAITGGLFIYISLVDMLPEVIHSSLLRSNPVMTIAMQNLGLWTGFLIMFALAAWEEDIKVAFK